MKTKFSDMSLAELDAHLKEVEALQKKSQDMLTTIDVNIEELTDEGVDIVFSRIHKLDSGAANDWTVVGPMMERNKLNVQYSDTQDEWDASEQDGLDFISGASPCIAIAKLMVIKSLQKKSSSEYLLQLPLGTAKALLIGSGEKVLGIMTTKHVNLADTAVVKLRLSSFEIR